jgi:hypothetical protein
MYNSRICRTAAATLAIAAIAAPAASAMPVGDGPITRGLYEPVPAEQTQDLRPPDVRDYAEGRGTYNAPEVVVVKAPAPEPVSAGGGIDWADVGMGAGGLLAIVAIGAGGAVAIHRRTPRALAR